MKPAQNQREAEASNDTRTADGELIASAAELKLICERIAAHGRVAVDTEFVWERTYYPNLGLVQLALNEKEAWLLDMPALIDNGGLEPLGDILADPEIEKIIHDAKQDLTILRLATGAYPKNIFDTRLAAGFIGPSATLSLLDSCARFAGLTLEKGETRSNWLQRPLTARQCRYALDDVLFLPLIRDKIMAEAKTLEREEWVREEMKIYDRPEMYDDPPADEVYSKVKGGARLHRRELAVLVQLAAWREFEARRQNRPRRHIIADAPLLEMAQKQPAELDILKKNCGLSPRAGQRYGKTLLEVIKKGRQTAAENYPESLKRSRDPEIAEQIRKIMDSVSETARENQLDPTLICTRKEIEKLLSNNHKNQPRPDNHPLLQGWRFRLVGERINQILNPEQ